MAIERLDIWSADEEPRLSAVLSECWQLLIDGAIVQAQICGGCEAAIQARRAASVLIATACPAGRS